MSFSISIVVCTYNGANRISNCLSSLVSQENPPEYEILVVDNASSDGTGDIVRTHLGSSFTLGTWRVITEDNPGLLYARLAGLRAAQHEWVLFCDDDNVLFPDFLFQCQQFLSQNPGIGVLGSLGIPEFLGSKPDWFERYSSSYAVGPQLRDEQGGKNLVHVYGACSIYRKKPLLDLFKKGFKPVLSGRKGKEMSAGDDVEWCWLMQLMGYKVAYWAKLKFIHQLPASRLTWEYYIRLKQGIIGSTGLLSSYIFYFEYSIRSRIVFKFRYWFEMIKSILIFYKYRFLSKNTTENSKYKFSYLILESRMKSFKKHFIESVYNFNQLNRFFNK